jgi:tetratricopeptide (TPR) repeat protein
LTAVWGKFKRIESTFRSAGQQVKEKSGGSERSECDEQLSGSLQAFETNLSLFQSLQKVSATMAQQQRALKDSEAELAVILAEIAMKCTQPQAASVLRSSSEALHACHKESAVYLDSVDLFSAQVSHLNATVGLDMAASIRKYDSHRRDFDSALLVHSNAEASSQSAERLAITYEHAQECRKNYERARESLRSKIALASNHYNIHLADNITKLVKAKATSAQGYAKPLARAVPYDPSTMDMSPQIVLATAK